MAVFCQRWFRFWRFSFKRFFSRAFCTRAVFPGSFSRRHFFRTPKLLLQILAFLRFQWIPFDFLNVVSTNKSFKQCIWFHLTFQQILLWAMECQKSTYYLAKFGRFHWKWTTSGSMAKMFLVTWRWLLKASGDYHKSSGWKEYFGLCNCQKLGNITYQMTEKKWVKKKKYHKVTKRLGKNYESIRTTPLFFQAKNLITHIFSWFWKHLYLNWKLYSLLFTIWFKNVIFILHSLFFSKRSARASKDQGVF